MQSDQYPSSQIQTCLSFQDGGSVHNHEAGFLEQTAIAAKFPFL